MAPSDAPTLSVVIPAFNEEATLAEVVEQVRSLPIKTEILIVDDGSRDQTGAIADQLAAEHESVRAFHQQNAGKGAAVRRGIQAATGDVVVIQDADLEYEPNDLPMMLKAMTQLESPVLYGSRRLRYRSSAVEWRFYFGGVLVTWLTNALYGSRLTDEPTCYKMWRRELIQSIPLTEDGFEFCAEVTAKVLRRGITIPEVQIRYTPRTIDEGKKIRLRDGITTVWTLMKHRLRS